MTTPLEMLNSVLHREPTEAQKKADAVDLLKYVLLQRFTLDQLRNTYRTYIEDEETKQAKAPKQQEGMIGMLQALQPKGQKDTSRVQMINIIIDQLTYDPIKRIAGDLKVEVPIEGENNGSK